MRKIYIPLALLFIIACSNQKVEEEEYRKELNEWKTNRLERLKSDRGWLNLAGLYWLDEGVNTLGSDSSNKIVFPEKAPAFLGEIIKKEDSLLFIAAENIPVKVDSIVRDSASLKPDATGKPSLMEYKDLAWYIIKRDSLFGIRLRDLNHPRVASLQEIPSFEPDTRWKKNAEFIPYDTPDTMMVPTVIGVDEKYIVPGRLRFSHKGKKYEILPFKAGSGLFMIIGDETSAVETYAAGRFLYSNPPDDENRVILDFNKAYNPPCAFSPFATCPLPPPENRLNLRITAGEKSVHLD